MSFIGTAAAGIGAASGLYSIYKGIKQEHDAGKIKPSPYATEDVGAALQAYNGNMPWATQAQQNIANAQANANAQASRNATNGAQLLALAQLGQGQADNAYSQLGQQEAQYHTNMLQNLNEAYRGATQEYDNVQQEKAQMAGAGAQSIQNGITGIGSDLLGYGAYKNAFGNNTPNTNNYIPQSTPPIASFSGNNITPLMAMINPNAIGANWLF